MRNCCFGVRNWRFERETAVLESATIVSESETAVAESKRPFLCPKQQRLLRRPITAIAGTCNGGCPSLSYRKRPSDGRPDGRLDGRPTAIGPPPERRPPKNFRRKKIPPKKLSSKKFSLEKHILQRICFGSYRTWRTYRRWPYRRCDTTDTTLIPAPAALILCVVRDLCLKRKRMMV